jgi:hypothetical protein
VGPVQVVFASALINDFLGLFAFLKYFTIEAFTTELLGEVLYICIFPRTAG